MAKLPNYQLGFHEMLNELEDKTGFHLSSFTIPEEMTFREWVEQLGRDGLKVDGKPFTLENRGSLHFVYDLIPTTIEEAWKKQLVLMKGAQMGLTVWEMLADIYMAIKFTPCAIGMYVPSSMLAPYKSTHRFLPILRTVPDAYEMLINASRADGSKRSSEGNVLTRVLGDSKLLFLWTTGSVATESFPLDIISFDEVQEMLISDMEKVLERMSASNIKFVMMLSTAKWPDSDIHYWYKQGKQFQFHNDCGCENGVILDNVFPQCIQYNNGEYGEETKNDYIYVCPVCKQHVSDNQKGQWIAKFPEATIDSLHLPQLISATVTPAEMITAYNNAEDMQNFYNRKLGKPFADPSQIPINMEMLNRCAEDGMKAGLKWKKSAKDTFMGIDQMGAFNCVLIKERMPDGRQATIHAESIYQNDPFDRCDELIREYGVAVCVVETLPNYNDAKRFAGRWPGRVFLANYGNLENDMIRWGDAQQTKTDRKTEESERDRHTVTLDQYKCMQTSLARLSKRQCVFPDPKGLHQDILIKGMRKRIPILKDEVFLHFTKTALVVEKDPEQKKFKRKVVKVGIDPHYSYTNMLCDVAWARAHGTTSFIMASETALPKEQQVAAEAMPGLPVDVLDMIQGLTGEVCGRCESYDKEKSKCNSRNLVVRPKDPGCFEFIANPFVSSS